MTRHLVIALKPEATGKGYIVRKYRPHRSSSERSDRIVDWMCKNILSNGRRRSFIIKVPHNYIDTYNDVHVLDPRKSDQQTPDPMGA